ncbi:polyketide synthase dehydratase [Hirsutella rhossiliensis]
MGYARRRLRLHYSDRTEVGPKARPELRPNSTRTREDFPPQVYLEITSPAKDYVVCTRPAGSNSHTQWQVCSRGRINAFNVIKQPDPESLHSITSRLCTRLSVNVDEYYSTIEKSGLRYGEAFRVVQEVWVLGIEVFASLELPKSQHKEAAYFRFYPALLDACLHSMLADVHYRGDARIVYLPHVIEKVHISDTNGAAAAFCDLHVYNETGEVIATILGFTAKVFQPELLTAKERTEADFTTKTFPRQAVYQKPVKRIGDQLEAAQEFKLDRRKHGIKPMVDKFVLRKDVNPELRGSRRSFSRRSNISGTSTLRGRSRIAMQAKDVKQECIHTIDPYEYWHTRRFKYPKLSRKALDLLTVAPMSAECERLFSVAGQMVTRLRSRLDALTIGTLVGSGRFHGYGDSLDRQASIDCSLILSYPQVRTTPYAVGYLDQILPASIGTAVSSEYESDSDLELYESTLKLQYNTIRGYVSAIQKLYDEQKSRGVNPAAPPQGVALKALKRSILATT